MKKDKYYLFLILLISSGCNNFSLYNNAIFNIGQNISRSKIVVDEKILSLPYAMSLITFHDQQSIMVLRSENANILEWVDANNEGFKTYEGKIIETHGFKNDIKIINYPDLKKIFLHDYIDKNILYKGFITFSNPVTNFLTINWRFELVEKGKLNHFSAKSVQYALVKETFHIPSIRWSGENFYWLDQNGQVIKSKSYIAPNLPQIRLETIKGYKSP